MPSALHTDVAIVGGGAAGLATAIFTRRSSPDRRVVVFEGARSPGAKILVSGGSRCNVTNAVVTERDFNGGRPAVIRRILRALPVDETITFFREIGVPLHEEPLGKLFPDSGRSRDVLEALLRETAAAGAELKTSHRVQGIERHGDGFMIATSQGVWSASRVVLATGGQSLPKTGSDGWGYTAARGLGHTIVPTTPALAPLVLDDHPVHAESTAMWRSLSGVAQPARLELKRGSTVSTRVDGALLWTHFGISGPAALDFSRHWLRARLENAPPDVRLSLRPADRFESLDADWVAIAAARPRLSVENALATFVPAAVARALLDRLPVAAPALAALTRDERRAIVHALLDWPLPVVDSRGYSYAEATAGGVPLAEIDAATMASRVCQGLYLVGEILDVDGRLGGFNFQWAWSSAKVAGTALSRV
jgi:predicted Rossmann fold flavoprotein